MLLMVSGVTHVWLLPAVTCGNRNSRSRCLIIQWVSPGAFTWHQWIPRGMIDVSKASKA